jgi:hypothetical protein
MRQNVDGFEVTVLFSICYAVDCFFIEMASETIIMMLHHVLTLSEVGARVLLPPRRPVGDASPRSRGLPIVRRKCLHRARCQGAHSHGHCFCPVNHYFRLVNLPIIAWRVWQAGKGTGVWPKLHYFES